MKNSERRLHADVPMRSSLKKKHLRNFDFLTEIKVRLGFFNENVYLKKKRVEKNYSVRLFLISFRAISLQTPKSDKHTGINDEKHFFFR